MGKRDEIREQLLEINPDEFDDFAADLWEHRGYDVEEIDDRQVTLKATSGGGLLSSSTTEVVQPLYREDGKTVDKSDMNRILEMRWEDDVDEIVVVTTTEFTEGARKQEKRSEVSVYNGDELADLIIEESAEGLVEKYAPSGSILSGLVWLCLILPVKITWIVLTFPIKLIFGSKGE